MAIINQFYGANLRLFIHIKYKILLHQNERYFPKPIRAFHGIQFRLLSDNSDLFIPNENR